MQPLVIQAQSPLVTVMSTSPARSNTSVPVRVPRGGAFSLTAAVQARFNNSATQVTARPSYITGTVTTTPALPADNATILFTGTAATNAPLNPGSAAPDMYFQVTHSGCGLGLLQLLLLTCSKCTSPAAATRLDY